MNTYTYRSRSNTKATQYKPMHPEQLDFDKYKLLKQESAHNKKMSEPNNRAMNKHFVQKVLLALRHESPLMLETRNP